MLFKISTVQKSIQNYNGLIKDLKFEEHTDEYYDL